MLTEKQFKRLKAFIDAGVFDDESREYGQKLAAMGQALFSGEAVVKRTNYGTDFDLDAFIGDKWVWSADCGTHPDGREYVHAGDIIANILFDAEVLPDPIIYFRQQHSIYAAEDRKKYDKRGKRPEWNEQRDE